MARKQFLINYHTSGKTNPSVNDVKKGEIVVKHNNENPELVILKNNNTFATFIDENAIEAKLSAVTTDLTGQIEAVAGDVATVSGNVKTLSANVVTELTKYDTREVAEGKIATAKSEAIASASAYTDAQVADAKTALTQSINTVASNVATVSGSVKTLSGGVATELAKYDTRTVAEGKIANAKSEAIASASAYTDAQVNAAKTALTQSINTVAADVATVSGNVNTLSGNVVTELTTNYAKSGDTVNAINKAKNDAVTSATTYSDEKLAAAVSALTEDIQGAGSDLTELTGKVNTLIGDDSNKSVRKIANEELAAQLLSGDADADFKTLQELAAWLENHPESVGEINANIASLSAATGSLLTNINNVVADVATVSGSVKTLSGGVATELAKYDTRTVAEGKIANAKSEAIASASAYTDAQVNAAKTALTQSINTVAADVATVSGSVNTLSGGVATELAKYDTRSVAEGKIANAKSEAIASASAYTDAQVNAAKTALTQSINTVAADVKTVSGDVKTLSGNVVTELTTNYAKSGDTVNAINKAKNDAIASASAYTDAAKSALTEDIQDVAGRVTVLEGLSATTQSAIQEIKVSGITGVNVVKSGTTRTINFAEMVIDGGEY